MRSTFAGLSMALRALMAQQTSIDTTNQNISNASTPGYSRQVADQVAFQPYAPPALDRPQIAGQLGTGVIVDSVNRIRDGFTDKQWRNENQTLGQAQVQQGILQQIESVYNEPSSNGLQALMAQFWNNWRDLSNNPESGAARNALVQNTVTMTDTFNQVRSQLVNMQQNLDGQVKLKVVDINNIAQQIASLNDQIVKVQESGDHPNDLLDQRDVLLDKLSQDVNMSYVTNPDGSIVVTVSGHPLVFGNQTNAMTTQPDPSNQGLQQVIWQDDGSPVNVQSGALMGMVSARDQTVAQQINQLDQVASTLITQVNNVVEQGYALDNSTGPAVQFLTGTNAQDIAVNPNVLNNVDLVAAASVANAPGDGSNALNVANIQQSLVMNGNSSTIDDYYNGVITDLGVKSQQATGLVDNETLLVQHLTQQRQQESGVSLDEESANLVKYQQSYEAAARVMTTVDEMLNTVINTMGLVGRG